jgi:hypothetical protein
MNSVPVSAVPTDVRVAATAPLTAGAVADVALPATVSVPVPVLLVPYAVALPPPVALPLIVIVPDEELRAPTAVAADPPTTDPTIATVPDPAFCSPLAPDAVPPVTVPVTVPPPAAQYAAIFADPAVTLPVMFSVPVLTFRVPELAEPAPVVGLPVTLTVPVELLLTPNELDPAPPVGFPVMFSVPVLVLVAPCLLPVVADPTGFPVSVAELPDVPEYVTQVVDPAIALLPDPVSVNVTPFESVNPPPATAVVPAVVLTVFAVLFESTVTVKLLA